MNDPLLCKLLDALEPGHATFVLDFVRTGKAGPSYRKMRPDVTEGTANTQAWHLLREQQISDAVRVARRTIGADVLMEARDVVREWVDVATANPADLMRVVHRACRHCHGAGFGYFWRDEEEYAAACQAALDAVKGTDAAPSIPDCSGGFGFKAWHTVNPDCPECGGEGRRDVFLQDTDKLSAKTAKLFAGLVVRKDGGIEVKTRDQDAALRNLAQYLGMLTQDVKLKGVLHTAQSNVELTADQKAALLKAVEGLDI